MARLMLVADTHLAPRSPGADDNWQAVLDHIAADPPDLVVHVGDISLDGADNDDDLTHSRRQLERLPVPWRVIPGNHDTGDASVGHPQRIDTERRERFRAVFGPQFWIEEIGTWRLVGVDTQYLLSDLDGVDEAWDELEQALGTERPTVVFGHHPLEPDGSEFSDSPRRYLDGPTRSRMRTLLADGSAKLYVSGHVHQWRQGSLDRFDYLWVPSTWATLPDRYQEHIGTKVVGCVELTLPDLPDQPGPAAARPEASLVRPAGIGSAVYADDFPSPYETLHRP